MSETVRSKDQQSKHQATCEPAEESPTIAQVDDTDYVAEYQQDKDRLSLNKLTIEVVGLVDASTQTEPDILQDQLCNDSAINQTFQPQSLTVIGFQPMKDSSHNQEELYSVPAEETEIDEEQNLTGDFSGRTEVGSATQTSELGLKDRRIDNAAFTSYERSTTSEGIYTSYEHAWTTAQESELRQNGFVKLNTHDISCAGAKIPDIDRFAEDLKKAVELAAWNPDRTSYQKVNVLLLNWMDDDLQVQQETTQLGHVFMNLYNFSVDSFKIPRKSPGKATTARINILIEQARRDTLIIVYYAGHSCIDKHSNQTLWAA